jgi:hypothetical protein
MLSRTADSIYWIARYTERAENVARLLDVTHRMSLLPGNDARGYWGAALSANGLDAAYQRKYGAFNGPNVVRYIVLDDDNPSSIRTCLRSARENAPPGNFIEATRETCYFQIGESKFGKPVLDRLIVSTTPLDTATKGALVSMDSTMKANLSVGLPLDLLVYREGALRSDQLVCIDDANPYFRMIHETWGQRLREVFDSLEDPRWDDAGTGSPLREPLIAAPATARVPRDSCLASPGAA